MFSQYPLVTEMPLISFFCLFLLSFNSTIDNSLMSNIQKLFSEKIEIFSAVEFSKVSVLTGIIKISLKVSTIDLLSINCAVSGYGRLLMSAAVA